MGLFDKLFGTRSEREIKKFSGQVDRILALEETYRQLTDEQLQAKTDEFKARLAQGETGQGGGDLHNLLLIENNAVGIL